jgi:hypothetical protein
MNGRWEMRGKASVVCLNILFGIFPEDLMEMKMKSGSCRTSKLPADIFLYYRYNVHGRSQEDINDLKRPFSGSKAWVAE